MSTLATVYDSSFKGIDFLDLYSGRFAAGDGDTEEQVNVIHIPGGNVNIIQTAGRLQSSLTLPIATDSDAIDDLRNAVATSGSLVYHGGTRTARLSKVSGVQKTASNDIYKASLLFYFT